MPKLKASAAEDNDDDDTEPAAAAAARICFTIGLLLRRLQLQLVSRVPLLRGGLSPTADASSSIVLFAQERYQYVPHTTTAYTALCVCAACVEQPATIRSSNMIRWPYFKGEEFELLVFTMVYLPH